MMETVFSTFKPRRLSIALALASTIMASSASATVYKYNEQTGAFVSSFSGNLSTSTLTTAYPSELNGKNISDIDSDDYMGLDSVSYHIIDSDGNLNYVNAVETTPYTYNISKNGTLTGGNLNGQTLNNDNYLGSAGGLLYYLDSTTNKVAYYTNTVENTYIGSYSWTTLSGGKYNGVTLASLLSDSKTFLTDMGGNLDIESGIRGVLFVEDDGTLGYYSIITGVYNTVFSDTSTTWGNWSTFSGGLLSGLTLSDLEENAIGTVAVAGVTYQYRYLGIGDDNMLFDVSVATAVPEPMTNVMMLMGLAAVFGIARKKSHV